MEKLTHATALPQFPLQNAEHVRDLIWFDGPLLCEYRIKGRSPYLAYWCDRDADHSRWMFVSVTETDLLRLSNGLIGLETLVPRGGTQPIVYLNDVDHEGNSIRSYVCDAERLPSSYAPGVGSIIESVGGRTDESSYTVLIQDEWSHGDLNDLNRNVLATYSTVYTLAESATRSISSYPVRSGFAGFRFYDEMISSVPVEHKGRLAAIHYSSPGFIKYAMLSEVAEKIVDVVGDVRTERIATPYIQLYRYYVEHNLNDVEAVVTKQHESEIGEIAERLIAELGLFSHQDLFPVCKSRFVAGKILVSFVRKLRWMNARVGEGRLVLP